MKTIEISNGSENTQLPNELTVFLKKVQRFKIEMNRIEEKNTDIQMKYDDIIVHYSDKKNKLQFERLFLISIYF